MASEEPVPPADRTDAGAADSNAPGPPIAGHQLGRYTLRARVARGGMAEIFLADVSDLPGVRRTVVIKRMLPELARDREHGRMFLDEARIMAGLVHPNVVQVVEVGREGDELYIAMEHIAGVSLSEVMADARSRPEPLPTAFGVHIVSGALAGLHYVHERDDAEGHPMQLVHRDVSPRNVLVSWEGGVKLIDFGIARQSNLAGRTRSGIVKGTIPYMSPEQCRGLHLDRRTDVFSTGILLWELTTGRRLFEAESDFDLLRMIVEGRIPPPRELVPGYPAALEEVVMRALARAPAERFQTAGEMLDALEATARLIGLAPSARSLQAYLRERLPERIAASQSARRGALPSGPVAVTKGTVEAVGSGSGVGEVVGEEVGETSPTKVARQVSGQSSVSRVSRLEIPRHGVTGWIAVVGLVAVVGGGAALVVKGIAVTATSPSPSPTMPTPTPTTTRTPTPATTPTNTIAPANVTLNGPVIGTATPAEPAMGQVRPVAVPGAGAASAGRTRVARSPAEPSVARAGDEVEVIEKKAAAPIGNGELVIDARPWCEVSIDGVKRGDTPLVVRLPAGVHQIQLRNEEYSILRTVPITVEADKTVRRKFDFPTAPTP